MLPALLDEERIAADVVDKMFGYIRCTASSLSEFLAKERA